MEKRIKKEIAGLTKEIGDILARLMKERWEYNDRLIESIFKINELQRQIAKLAEDPQINKPE